MPDQEPMPDQEHESVSEWIERVRRSGNDDAASLLWRHFLLRLSEYVSQRIRTAPLRIHDTEDVVLSTFDSVLRAIRENRYQDVKHRDDLWWLLLAVADRKAIDVERFERRKKRGGGRTVQMSFQPIVGLPNGGWPDLASAEPTPEFAVVVEEETRRLFGLLNARQRVAVRMRLEGHSNRDIAGALECSVPTIERYLHLTRRIWNAELQDA
jgi:DNA-directed RNA polymerase specialized sigma24 family protein